MASDGAARAWDTSAGVSDSTHLTQHHGRRLQQPGGAPAPEGSGGLDIIIFLAPTPENQDLSPPEAEQIAEDAIGAIFGLSGVQFAPAPEIQAPGPVMPI